jgi:polyhydroxyalkanoate synthesis repressor PhaR
MSERRTIKRYTNRKLYDKRESRYVTLEEIARLVRAGEDIQVIDNETEEDLTSVTFAQIILEEEKRKQNLLSVPFLRKLIRTGEARVQDISDRASRSIEAIGDLTGKYGDSVRGLVGGGASAIEGSLNVLDEWFGMPQKRLAELGLTAREQIDKIRVNPTVKRELERIAASLHTLEEAVAKMAEEPDEGQDAQAEAGDQDADGAGSRPAESGDFSTSAKTSVGNGTAPDAEATSAESAEQDSSDKPDRNL